MATIAYSDIFSYPLTLAEIHQFLVEKKLTRNALKRSTSELVAEKKLAKSGVFYFLPGREKIVETRLKRQKITRQKSQIAQKAAGLISLIPSVKMVGLTGALAVGNSDKDDDVDFLVVCQTNTVWLTRFLTTLMLSLLGRRRLPDSRKFKDKICLNMFLDEGKLKLKPSLYLAHEIVQMKPLCDFGIYQKMIAKNRWVEKYLPNWRPANSESVISRNFRYEFHNLTSLIWEKLFKTIQYLYMKKKITTEEISDTVLRFHPNDASIWIEKEYQKKLARLSA